MIQEICWSVFLVSVLYIRLFLLPKFLNWLNNQWFSSACYWNDKLWYNFDSQWGRTKFPKIGILCLTWSPDRGSCSLAWRLKGYSAVSWPRKVDKWRCNLNNCWIRWNRKPAHLPVGRAVTRSSLEREVWGLNLGPVKSNSVLPTATNRCDISSKGTQWPRHNDIGVGSANSLHVST